MIYKYSAMCAVGCALYDASIAIYYLDTNKYRLPMELLGKLRPIPRFSSKIRYALQIYNLINILNLKRVQIMC